MQSVVREYEDKWGFGQLLPFFLLFLPLSAVPGFYTGEIQSKIGFSESESIDRTEDMDPIHGLHTTHRNSQTCPTPSSVPALGDLT
jgi:hypothetical protein